MKTRKPRIEVLEDRFAPALLLTGGHFTFAADPGQSLVVLPSASVEFTADVTMHDTITADNAGIIVAAGCTLTAPSISGGFLSGPGTFDVASLANARVSSSATVTHVTWIENVLNQGLLTLDHTPLTQFVNGSAGRLLIVGPVGGGFESWGQVIVTPTGYVSGSLDLRPGSVTTIQRAGPLDGIGDGMVDGNITLVGGLLTNHGISNGTVTVGAAGKVVGSGYYYEVNTNSGGAFSPGGSPSTMATVGGDIAGFVTVAAPTATGTLVAFDPDAGQSVFQAGSFVTLYGSFAIAANGQWSYTLDATRPATALALTHTGVFNDPISVLTADGTPFDLEVSIHG